jgi:hypothetical protein
VRTGSHDAARTTRASRGWTSACVCGIRPPCFLPLLPVSHCRPCRGQSAEDYNAVCAGSSVRDVISAERESQSAEKRLFNECRDALCARDAGLERGPVSTDPGGEAKVVAKGLFADLDDRAEFPVSEDCYGNWCGVSASNRSKSGRLGESCRWTSHTRRIKSRHRGNSVRPPAL